MHLIVSPQRQVLEVYEGESLLAHFPVSTSKFGLGEEDGSHRTPRGHHQIQEKIGAGVPPGTIFQGRKPTGKIWKPEIQTKNDLILTRILWLAGRETHNANSHQRYIYLHGTNQEDQIGSPVSIGCIRLRNQDIIQLFDMVHVQTPITILDDLN